MAKHRKRRDGTKTEASTLWIAEDSVKEAHRQARERNIRENRKINKHTKASLFIESIERDY